MIHLKKLASFVTAAIFSRLQIYCFFDFFFFLADFVVAIVVVVNAAVFVVFVAFILVIVSFVVAAFSVWLFSLHLSPLLPSTFIHIPDMHEPRLRVKLLHCHHCLLRKRVANGLADMGMQRWIIEHQAGCVMFV